MNIVPKFVVIAAFGICGNANLQAQKLPNKQEESIWAPANVTYNTTPSIWNIPFSAYNHATDIYYSLLNNSEYVYLEIKAADPTIIQKIMRGGITIVLQSNDESLTLTYPKYDKDHKVFDVGLPSFSDTVKDAGATKEKQDAAAVMLTNKFNRQFSIIGVQRGKETMNDVSLTKLEGIKAEGYFDTKNSFIYEIAVANTVFKYGSKLRYNIKLNGVAINGGIPEKVPGRDALFYTGPDGVNYALGRDTPENRTKYFPTDFSGEYTLAKKP